MLHNKNTAIFLLCNKSNRFTLKRNFERFDEVDFMFQLTKEEFKNLKCQNGTSSWGGKRKLPFVFTEQGVYMLATVVNSSIAVKTTKNIMRTFTKMREFALGYKDIVIELQNIKEDLKLTKDQSANNTKHTKTAFELLSQILEDTEKTEEKIIGIRPKKKE